MTLPLWSLDLDDPRAPTRDVWEQLSEAERAKVVASLPADMPLDLHPPEGDPHRKPKERARDALDQFFQRIGRRVYVSSELTTYYPGEPRFCPDILAVLDVEPHDRMSWIVTQEGKGLDFVIEVLVAGSVRKDLETNVTRYARLGIPEYFVFDRARARLHGYRLGSRSANYERIVPQAGRSRSEVLGLDLTIEGGMLRFYHGTAPLLFMDELVGKLNSMIAELIEARDDAIKRAEEEAQRAKEEAQRAKEEAQQAESLRQRITELEQQIERLRS